MARKKNENNYALQTIITKDAAKYLSDLAKADDRSMVKYVKRVIMQHLKDNGYVEKDTIEKDNEVKVEEKCIQEEEKDQKKNSSLTEQVKEIKQPANCTQSSVTRTRNRNTKVAPVPASFVK